ncbi:hypothetical protein J6590_053980 [Homalodisca vitripennis]|nr:hypothetical protein J6590_053980 [Homalodisca vitripennis]
MGRFTSDSGFPTVAQKPGRQRISAAPATIGFCTVRCRLPKYTASVNQQQVLTSGSGSLAPECAGGGVTPTMVYIELLTRHRHRNLAALPFKLARTWRSQHVWSRVGSVKECRGKRRTKFAHDGNEWQQSRVATTRVECLTNNHGLIDRRPSRREHRQRMNRGDTPKWKTKQPLGRFITKINIFCVDDQPGGGNAATIQSAESLAIGAPVTSNCDIRAFMRPN